MKINKIVIVGGGSAGWMTASILIKKFPEKNISLIESPNVQKIGVGESTFQGINYYLEHLEIDRGDFFKKTDASIKLAIKFRNFYKESGEPDFIYPFGSPVLRDTLWGVQDWFIKKNINKEIPVNDYAESYFPAAHLVKYGRMSDNLDESLENFDPVLGTALHFDAIKFANWLKDNYAIPRGVKNIVGHVQNVVVNNDGIEKLILEDGLEIFADLFVDCTGFKSLLLSESLKEEFVSYNDILPNTHAWATRINYKNPEKELDTVTRCTALKNGWCWNIPLWSRLGSGYVYSDKYTTHESALEEFKNYLARDIDIPRSLKEIESLSFNNIQMRVGIHKRVWVKNVVAIGLSAGFIEPLESNGLFSVHEFLFELVRSLQSEKVSQWNKDAFNYAVKLKFDQFVEFIRVHYMLSIRDDSEYWKDNFNRSYDIDASRKNDYGSTHIYSLQKIKTQTFDPPTNSGLSWISTGMNYFLLDDIAIKSGEILNKMKYKTELEPFFDALEQKKKMWSMTAKNSPTMYQYLDKKYYK
jgi:hypothetical protein